MYNVSVVEVGHEEQSQQGKCEAQQLFVVAVPLQLVEMGPDEVVGLAREEKGSMGGRQVEQETLFVKS